ncbi:MAG: nuclear transport factor 2 family protein [Myxococcota bacterium]
MNANEIGKKVVDYVRAGRNLDCVMELYADGVISVEPVAMGEMGRITEGKAAVLAKNEGWASMHEVHSGAVEGPFAHGDDRFALIFRFDVTNKPSGQRMNLEEVGVYQVKDGRIAREEYFYGG